MQNDKQGVVQRGAADADVKQRDAEREDAEQAETIAAIFVRHPLWEDALALLLGTAMVALGIAFYSHAGLLTGGTVGLAFLLKYFAGWPFGLVFFTLNIPFYLLAIWRSGDLAHGLELYAAHHHCGGSGVAAGRTDTELDSLCRAALLGGFAMGVGLLMLFHHRASLGGVNILALFLQERFGLRAGTFQMGIDALIVLAAVFIVPLDKVALSVLGAVALNLVLAINHRSDRYMGVS